MGEKGMNAIRQRARNALVGLAIGDALSWPAMFHRSHLLPSWTRRIRREIDTASEISNVLALAMPFSLNQPADVFDIGPVDDAEWASFTINILLNGDGTYEDALISAWLTLAQSGEVIKGGVSTQAALSNLRKGIKPPRSGRENPHYFDDGAVARAVPVGIFCTGNPVKAAQLAALDASVTNAEDGVWAAQSMAVAVSLACSGKDVDETLSESIQVLPQSSLVRRKVDDALALTRECGSLFSVLPKVQNAIVNREYSYGNAAPETLALAFVITKMMGLDFERAITTAASFAKTADSLPAMVGALVGAMNPGVIASDDWLAAVRNLKGICIPTLKGTDFLELSNRLIDAAIENSRERA